MGGSPKRGGTNGSIMSRGRVILVAVLLLQLVLVVCLMKAPRLVFVGSSTRSSEVVDSALDEAPASRGSWLWRKFVISTTAPNCTDANGRVVTEAVKGSSIKCGDRSSLLRMKWIEPKHAPKRQPSNPLVTAEVARGPVLRKVNATTRFRNVHGATAGLREGRTRRGAVVAHSSARNESSVARDFRQRRVHVGRELPATGDPAMASSESPRETRSSTLRLRRDYAANVRSSLERDSHRFRGRIGGFGDRSSGDTVQTREAQNESAAIAPVARVQSSNVSAAIAPVARVQASNVSAAIAPVARVQASNVSAAIAPVARVLASNVSASIAPASTIRSNVSDSVAPVAEIRPNVSDSVAPAEIIEPTALVYEDVQPEDEVEDELAVEPEEADPDVAIARSQVSFGGRRGPLPSFNASVSSNISLEISPRNTSLEISPKNPSLEISPRNASLEISPRNTSLEISMKNTSLEISPYGPTRNTSLDQISESLKTNTTSLKKLEQVASPLSAQSAAQNATLRNATSERNATDSIASNATCPRGLIYVYTLPKKFNTELLENCTQLLAWGDRCRELSNSGLGPSLGESPLSRHSQNQGKQESNEFSDGGPWYGTDQFNGEVIFHKRILGHPCRTHNPELAKAFYIPYYGGLDVARFLFNITNRKFTAADRDKLGSELVQWLARSPYWKRRQGLDHFLFLGRITWDFRRKGSHGWGSGLIYMPEMENVTKLALERSPWDSTEMAIPYPTVFHPRNDSEVVEWQNSLRTTRRDLLFSFAGGKRKEFPNDFRVALFEQCKRATSCEVLDCSQRKCVDDALAVTRLFIRSTFCLQPRGDSFTRRSIFDSLIAGCIPVFFWTKSAYLQYKWHFPANHASYSVFIPKKDIRNGVQIEDVLRRIPPAKIQQMQETVVKMLPRLVYAAPPQGLTKFRDAFDTTIDKAMANFELRLHQNATTSPSVIKQTIPVLAIAPKSVATTARA